ncbi:hypothetical protein PSPO01_03467 [Paraphaeosphaeria sporulosa]
MSVKQGISSHSGRFERLKAALHGLRFVHKYAGLCGLQELALTIAFPMIMTSPEPPSGEASTPRSRSRSPAGAHPYLHEAKEATDSTVSSSSMWKHLPEAAPGVASGEMGILVGLRLCVGGQGSRPLLMPLRPCRRPVATVRALARTRSNPAISSIKLLRVSQEWQQDGGASECAVARRRTSLRVTLSCVRVQSPRAPVAGHSAAYDVETLYPP